MAGGRVVGRRGAALDIVIAFATMAIAGCSSGAHRVSSSRTSSTAREPVTIRTIGGPVEISQQVCGDALDQALMVRSDAQLIVNATNLVTVDVRHYAAWITNDAASVVSAAQPRATKPVASAMSRLVADVHVLSRQLRTASAGQIRQTAMAIIVDIKALNAACRTVE